MKLGFGLYRHQLDEAHYRFARQCGATSVVVHWVDYFRSSRSNSPSDQPIGNDAGWGLAGDPDQIWSCEELAGLKAELNSYGLELAALENFDPAHWHDVLLDGPRKHEQFEKLRQIIRNVGRAGIPVIGYNFSIAGVCGREKGPWGRGGADVVALRGEYENPVPRGMVWNMVYDRTAGPGCQPTITHEELWRRHGEFLDAVVPTAEECGVVLAAHPDDPPLPFMRRQPRLVFQPAMFQRVLDRRPSRANALELCLGTVAEMTEGDVYEVVDRYTRQGNVAYIHFRNVCGKVPQYQEAFIDEGDIDMHRVLQILRRNKFEGVLIPDHVPQLSCPGPWYAGMAYAMGWMRAAMSSSASAVPESV